MPYISQDFIQSLPDKVDIVDFINKRVPLKKSGADYRAPCPFHGGKNNNFSVSISRQFYHCFKCGESGGVVNFVMKFDNLDFKEAVEAVAAEAGIAMVYDRENSKPVDDKIPKYKKIMLAANDFYKANLKNTKINKTVVNYARQRGLKGDTAKVFELGFARSGAFLFNYFKDDDEAIEDLEKMGLIVKKDEGEGYYDRFRDRLMFPIHGSKGDIIGFGGRILSADGKPKYLNSPETPLFSKSKELYGLYQCRKFSRNIDFVLVVEGYLDVIALHQNGVKSVVATLGTATTSQHLQILSRTTKTIIFCFDGDKAGRDAALKALKISLPVIKSGMFVKFLFLPDQEDPDSLIKKESLKKFEKRIENADSLSKFLFDSIKSKVKISTIEGKTEFVEKAVKLIQQVNYEVYQQQLLEGVAKIVKQNIEQVKFAFSLQEEKMAAKTQFAYEGSPDDYQIPDFVGDVTDDMATDITADMADTAAITPTMSPKNTNKLHDKMISLLLNYPIIADEADEKKLEIVKKSPVLFDIIQSAKLDNDISDEQLLKPFKNQDDYQHLQKLRTMTPHFNEEEAKIEFLDALKTLAKQQQKSKTKAAIATADTLEKQQKIAKNLSKKTPQLSP